MKMRVSPQLEGLRVQASQTEALGIRLDAGPSDYGLSLGFENRGHLSVATNAAVRLEWLSADLFGVRAGTNLAPDLVPGAVQNKAKNP
jgi:hypothetical protein